MDPNEYTSKLVEIGLRLNVIFNAAKTEVQLQQLQQLMLDWHSNALAKEISLDIARQARTIKNRTLLGQPIGGQQP
ncbi:MAG: hypothetical protein HC771_22285 [Synechococcales cyanobacterium CRU_2_2]|nr:hypothetical protein [Synechococcales cyanobacterium CRU_2_2]